VQVKRCNGLSSDGAAAPGSELGEQLPRSRPPRREAAGGSTDGRRLGLGAGGGHDPDDEVVVGQHPAAGRAQLLEAEAPRAYPGTKSGTAGGTRSAHLQGVARKAEELNASAR
jgi:hypothetical protein